MIWVIVVVLTERRQRNGGWGGGEGGWVGGWECWGWGRGDFQLVFTGAS